jgi:hypothetical protein
MRRAFVGLFCVTAACGGAAPDAAVPKSSERTVDAAAVTVDVPPPVAQPETRGRARDDIGVAPGLNAREAKALKEIDHQIDVALEAPGLIPKPISYGSYGGAPWGGTASVGTNGGPGSGGGSATGSTAAPTGPTGTATSTLVPTAAPLPDNVQTVLAGTAAGLRRCYHRALQSDPTLRGALELRLVLGADGGVLRAEALPPSPVPSDLTACIQARFQAAQFAPTRGPTSFRARVVLTPNPP